MQDNKKFGQIITLCSVIVNFRILQARLWMIDILIRSIP